MKYGYAVAALIGVTLAACSSSTSAPADTDDTDSGVAPSPTGSMGTSSGEIPDSGSSPTPDAATDSGTGTTLAPGTATVTGSIPGFTLPVPKDVITFNQDGFLTIRITDYANSCPLLTADDEHKQNSKYLQLYLDAYPGVPATHTVDGNTYSAIFFTRDATCSSTRTTATGGTVSITSVTAAGVLGSFDLTFAGGDVKGTFNAPVCNSGLPEGSGGACVP